VLIRLRRKFNMQMVTPRMAGSVSIAEYTESFGTLEKKDVMLFSLQISYKMNKSLKFSINKLKGFVS
jgi:hypothetical protein